MDDTYGCIRTAIRNCWRIGCVSGDVMATGRSQMAKQVSKSGDKKDACYSKVKARYKVWPSAYASGALAKCRKVGAKSWGTKSKKGGSKGRATKRR